VRILRPENGGRAEPPDQGHIVEIKSKEEEPTSTLRMQWLSQRTTTTTLIKGSVARNGK
jgi:hypothetical protein